MTERQPNKANLVSDPQDDGFEYTVIDDDGVAWYAAPTEKPSAFVKWVPFHTYREKARMTEWKPIATAPRDGTPILASWAGSMTHGEVPRIVYMTWFDGHYSYCDPTHWMPIPANPQKSA